ncbi:MAG: hypothetical protein ACLPX7_25170 [Xanthobacteraceae bacterium]
MGSILSFIARGVFDDATTRIMGEAFDEACKELHDTGQQAVVREAMAKRIVAAARRGERDVTRLRNAALGARRKDRLRRE